MKTLWSQKFKIMSDIFDDLTSIARVFYFGKIRNRSRMQDNFAEP